MLTYYYSVCWYDIILLTNSTVVVVDAGFRVFPSDVNRIVSVYRRFDQVLVVPFIENPYFSGLGVAFAYDAYANSLRLLKCIL